MGTTEEPDSKKMNRRCPAVIALDQEARPEPHECDLPEGHPGPHREESYNAWDESFRTVEW